MALLLTRLEAGADGVVDVRQRTRRHEPLEQKVCLVCAKTFDSGALLLDTRVKDSMEHYTVTGWDLCPEDKAKYDDGYVALVEARTPAAGMTLMPEEAYRLGRIVHIREAAFDTIFEHPELLIPVLEAAGYSVSLKTEENDATMAKSID